MDQDLIKLVNRLQDTFHNLGKLVLLTMFIGTKFLVPGGELDMPQLVVVCRFAKGFCPSRKIEEL